MYSFVIAFLWSCNNGEIENPSYSVVQIDSISRVHLGRGYYKIYAHYALRHGENIIQGKCEYRTVRSYNTNIAIGDSALLKYDEHDMANSEIVKVVYKKKKIKL